MTSFLSYTDFYQGSGHNGGAETTLHDFMRRLRLEKHKTRALLGKPCPDGSASYVLDGVMVQAFASKQDPEYIIPTVDAVVSHLGQAGRASIIARRAGKPAIQLIHNDQEYCITYAEKYADLAILNTNWVKPKYSNVRQTVVLHPMVDPSRYSIDSSREYITIVNLTVGQTNRLSYDKGAHTFYELARRFPHEKFLGVKGGYGDQYVPDNLPKNVTIMEHNDSPLDIYRKSKVVLVPSKYESYGRVPLEAACSAIPSVVTETDGLRESMGYSARFCQFGNYDEWEAGLQDVLDHYDDFSYLAAKRAAQTWSRTNIEWFYLMSVLDGLIGG